MGTVKAGWLQKLSGFFKNTWKRRYFVLYSDGQFCYFQDPNDQERDGQIHMKTECRRIDVGYEVGEGVKAPKGTDTSALFSVASPDRTWFLCAETETECRDWVRVLEEARIPLAYQAGGHPSVMPYPSPAEPPPPYSQGMPQPAQASHTVPYPQQGPGQLPPYPSQQPPRGPYPQPPGPYPQQPQVPYPQHPQGPSYPTSSYPAPQQPYPYQPYPQGMQPRYPPPLSGYCVPPRHPSQHCYPAATTCTQQQSHQSSSGGGSKKLLMGAAAGALGGAAMGYMVGNALGGFGHHGYGGWDSDHSWSSGGSFDGDFD